VRTRLHSVTVFLSYDYIGTLALFNPGSVPAQFIFKFKNIIKSKTKKQAMHLNSILTTFGQQNTSDSQNHQSQGRGCGGG
jgi:hypothetical protein